MIMKEIKLTQDKFAKVSDCDYESVSKHKWFFNTGYASRMATKEERVGGKRRVVFMHRFIINVKKEKEIDHINGDRLDNRRENLRECTHSQNLKSQKVPINNTSGFKGVTKQESRWLSRIQFNGRYIHIGSFKNKEDAALAYNLKAKELFGEFALLNNI